jgi:hypothetical protein
MPATPAGPKRRVPTAHRQPPRLQPRRRPAPSTGRWPVVIAVVALCAAAIAGWWFVKPGPAPGQSPAQRPLSAASPSPTLVDAAPLAVTEEQLRRALAEAPLLAPAAARALLTESARRGQHPPHALDHALFVASEGFPDLDRRTLDELGELFSKAWGARPASDQRLIQAYMQFARTGEPHAPEALARGRELVGGSVRSLPPAAQGRLAALFARAVAAGIAHRQQAEERARVAALVPVPVFEAPPVTADRAQTFAQATPSPSLESAAPPGSGAGTIGESDSFMASERASRERSEGYWRSRAARARSAVAAAEKRVKDLEEEAARAGPVVPGPTLPACQAGVSPRSLESGGPRIDPNKAISCNDEILRQQAALRIQARLDAARESLKQAQTALDDLDDEARRAGALPGWLR